MTKNSFDELLFGVEKPSRYLGTEVNAFRQGKKGLNFLLAFPDTYEVGMSHLGLRILYSILNSLPDVNAERCFAPWPDRENQLRLHNLPLSSLESRTPIGNFDIIGFSLQYELSYTNVLNMMDMGKIPLHTRDRNNDHPLIIAGGPCCFNPAPLSNFIDAFVIGEGEEIISEISATLRKGKQDKSHRAKILENLAHISGIYVPSVHKKDCIIKKRTVSDLNQWAHPQKPVVPLMQAVHDRIVLEIARGCTRGCRFCQAGMIWRPYRERDSSLLMEMAEKNLQTTGHDEISLLSLSAGDYTCIEGLMQNLIDKYYTQRVALALPSLRVESLNEKLIESIKRIRKTSFTLAPEAGTDKMRRTINKGNTSEDLLSTIDKVFSAGWKSIKLYFMIGLPGEEQEDLEGIISLSHEAVRAAKNRGQVTISLSTFIPKPHTPFQWEEQISLEEIYKRQDFIRRQTKNRRISFKWHDARMSFLEGIFSRGDESIGLLLEEAFKMGCRFDGWSEIFRFDLWQKAIQETGIDASQFLRARGLDEALPWDNIDCGVSRDFLSEEKQKAQSYLPTPDCRFDECQLCGVCNFSTIKNVFSANDDFKKTNQSGAIPDALNILKNTYRFTFRKVNQAKFLSHLEISAALTRALRQCAFPLFYSSGFHPHPKISFAAATAVGTESFQEYMDVGANQEVFDFTSLKKAINSALPAGLEIDEIKIVSPQEKSLADALHGFVYEINLPENFDNDRLEIIKNNIDKFAASSIFTITRFSKDATSNKNIRPFVESIMLDLQGKKIKCTVLFSHKGSARAADIITRVAGLNEAEAQKTKIVKTKTILK